MNIGSFYNGLREKSLEYNFLLTSVGIKNNEAEIYNFLVRLTRYKNQD